MRRFALTGIIGYKIDMYDDIIDLPRPVSKTHPPMSIEARAAQFSPYAALVGHKDLVAAEETLAEQKIDLDHDFELEANEDYDCDYDYGCDSPEDF